MCPAHIVCARVRVWRYLYSHTTLMLWLSVCILYYFVFVPFIIYDGYAVMSIHVVRATHEITYSVDSDSLCSSCFCHTIKHFKNTASKGIFVFIFFFFSLSHWMPTKSASEQVQFSSFARFCFVRRLSENQQFSNNSHRVVSLFVIRDWILTVSVNT